MSNFPDAHKVYDLAAVFRERVIEQGRSFLWPNQEIWTVENAGKLFELESKLYWSRPGIKLPELANALRQESIEICMMGADVQAVCHLFRWLTYSTFQRQMDHFIQQPDMPEVDPDTWEKLYEQSQMEVPSSYKAYKQTSVQWHLSALSTLEVLRRGASGSPDIAELESLLVTSMPAERQKMLWDHWVWQIAHVLYPTEVAPLPVDEDRKRVIARYKSEAGVDPRAGEFSQLKTIRGYLGPRFGEDYVDFYDKRVFLEWEKRKDKVDRWTNFWGKGAENQHTGARAGGFHVVGTSEYVRGRPIVYEIAEQFRKQVLEQGNSLLWPTEEVWTDQAIEEFLSGFKEMPVEKGKSWLQIYENQFANRSPVSARILADSYAFIMQFPSLDVIGAATKTNTLRTIAGWAPETPPEDVALEKVFEGFGFGVGSPGRYFSNNVQYQLAFVPSFVRQFRRAPEEGVLSAVNAAVVEVKQNYDFKKSVAPARNIVLHLLEPNRYERIASNSDKVLINERFAEHLDLDLVYDDIDVQIQEIRSNLENGFFHPGFDFYDEEVVPYWKGDRTLEPIQNAGENKESLTPPSIADLAAATYLDVAFLKEIESLLKDKRQLIFEGPPGSGKTFVADKFARYFAGQPLDSNESNEQIELVQFHQSYSYEDFVEGIRPRTNDAGQLIYDVEPGVFREFAARAQANPDKPFVLIIDEINRGNVSRILGELMLLLEYRNKSARLPYSKKMLQIPNNLYIIGTMNSADRSLSQIDYALRRRFYFVRFMSVENSVAQVLQRWLNLNGIDSSSVLPLFIRLNALLEQHVGTDDLQVGHSYFMREDIHLDAVQEQVWTYAVMPLLREYLYHHRERDLVLAQFELLRIGPPPVTIAETSAVEGSETYADVNVSADHSSHE